MHFRCLTSFVVTLYFWPRKRCQWRPIGINVLKSHGHLKITSNTGNIAFPNLSTSFKISQFRHDFDPFCVFSWTICSLNTTTGMSDPEKAAELQKTVTVGQSPSQGCNADNAYWSGSSLPTQVSVSNQSVTSQLPVSNQSVTSQ